MIFFFFQAEDGIRDLYVTGVQTCALPISRVGRNPSTPPAARGRRGDSVPAGRALGTGRGSEPGTSLDGSASLPSRATAREWRRPSARRRAMIPAIVETHLRAHHIGYEHHRHASAATAQELAAAEHVSGYLVAKPVVVKLGGELALAVVSAAERVSVSVLEESTGTEAELVPEAEFAGRFEPCDAGAEPALSVFGVPIFADEKFLHARRIEIGRASC